MNDLNTGVNISKYRAVLGTYNLIGSSIVLIKSSNIDLCHNQKIKDNDPLRLVRPIKQYEVVTIDVTESRVFNGPDGVALFIEFNGKADLQFQVVNKQIFPDATSENITKAIKILEETGEITCFLDLQRATDQVRKYNSLERAKCEKAAEELMAWAEGLKTINKVMEDECRDYYAELGLLNEA